MIFGKKKNIEKVWDDICKHEGEAFYTITNIEYKYVVKDNYILINNDSRRRVTKSTIGQALEIEDPTPSKINRRCQSYIYGIIVDHRVI